MEKMAYVTVLTNLYYLKGTIALDRALKKVKSKYSLHVLVPCGSEEIKDKLAEYGISSIEEEPIEVGLDIDNSPEYRYWKETFFKLKVMKLTQFDKIVLLDSDLLILKNIDELFERPHRSAAVMGEYTHPENKKLNSGVIVLKPDIGEYERLIEGIKPAYERLKTYGKSCGDQDVFHYVWSDWVERPELKLDETFNTCIYDAGALAKNLKNGVKDIRIVHFTGAKKPWSYGTKENLLTLVGRSFVDRNFVRYKLLKQYENYCRL